MNVVHKPRQFQSSEASHSQHSSSQVLDPLDDQLPHYQVHDLTMVEPEMALWVLLGKFELLIPEFHQYACYAFRKIVQSKTKFCTQINKVCLLLLETQVGKARVSWNSRILDVKVCESAILIVI